MCWPPEMYRPDRAHPSSGFRIPVRLVRAVLGFKAVGQTRLFVRCRIPICEMSKDNLLRLVVYSPSERARRENNLRLL